MPRKFIQLEITDIIFRRFTEIHLVDRYKIACKNSIDSTYTTNFSRLIMSPYIRAFYPFYVHALAKSSPAGRIQVCLTARIKFTGVPAETAREISFEEIHSEREMGRSCVALKVRVTGLVRFAPLNSQLLIITVNLNQPVMRKDSNGEIKGAKGRYKFEREPLENRKSTKSVEHLRETAPEILTEKELKKSFVGFW